MIHRCHHAVAAVLHAAVLLAAVCVPIYAVAAAVGGLATAPGERSLAEIVDAPRWLALLGHTAVVCAAAVAVAVGIGLLYGLLIGRTNLPGRTLLAGAALLSACVPIYISIIFILAFAPTVQFSSSTVVCGVLYGLLYAPLAVLVLRAALRGVDRELEETALLDAGRARVLWRVTVPQAGWAVATLAMLIVLLVATDYTITDLLRVRTFAEEVFTQFELHRTAGGPLLTALPLLATLGALLVGLQARYRFVGESAPWQMEARPLPIPLGRGKVALAAVAFLMPLALLIGPATALLRHVRSIGEFTFHAGKLWPDVLMSLWLSAAGAGVMVLFSVGLAWCAVRGGRLKWPTLAALVALLAMPAPVVGISLIGMLNRAWFTWLGREWPGAIYDSWAVVVIGYVVRFLPIGVLLLLPAIQRVPPELDWSAQLDGCGWWARQRHVYWPAARRQAAVAALVLMILCFGEVGATMLLAPPAYGTVASVRAFTLIHYGVYPDLATLALMCVGCIVVLWLPLALLLHRRRGAS